MNSRSFASQTDDSAQSSPVAHLHDSEDEGNQYGIGNSPKLAKPADPEERRFYVLGPGAVGLFVAHQLSALSNPPPVTLILHKQELPQRWEEVGRQLRLTRHGVTEARSNIDVVRTRQLFHEAAANPEQPRVISQLVLAVKAHHAVNALQRVQAYLRPWSTILFLQNGMGVIDEVNERLFPDPEERPRYMVGSVSHGLVKDAEFAVTHRSVGAITLSIQPTVSVGEWERPLPSDRMRIAAWPPSSRRMLRALTAAPMLRASGVAPFDALPPILRKLAGNAVINPLTALFSCKNGELLNNTAAGRLMNMLLAEISLVLRALPEVRALPEADTMFAVDSLRNYVVGLCRSTADNDSSMLQDVRAGRQTEINYINGWIVRRGEKLGLKCIVSFTVEQMILAKGVIAKNQAEGLLPLEMPRMQGMMESYEGDREQVEQQERLATTDDEESGTTNT